MIIAPSHPVANRFVLQDISQVRNQPIQNIVQQSSHRARIRSDRLGAPPLSNAERQRRFRERARRRAIRIPNESGQVSRIGTNSIQRDENIRDNWMLATRQFDKMFNGNSYGHPCNVCDRLWFEKDLKKVKDQHLEVLRPVFGSSSDSFMLCSNCKQTLDRGRMPQNSISNGFKYPDKPPGLPALDPISTRLISPRIPFMAIRRLRWDGAFGIVGQVINIPVDVDSMVRNLPRQLDDDYAFNVSIKRKLIHRSSYLTGHVRKRVLKSWLTFLVRQPLYRHYNITVDPSFLGDSIGPDDETQNPGELDGTIEEFEANQVENEVLLGRQHTLLRLSTHNILE